MSVIYLIQGDSNPTLKFQLKYPSDLAVDLTGATVNFIFRLSGYSEKIFKRECVVTVASEGRCQYAWQSGDLVDAGRYDGELEVIFPDSKIQTTKNIVEFYVREELDADNS